MNRNFSLKFRIFDVFVIIFALLVSSGIFVGILVKNKSFKSEHRIVNIYHDNKLISKYQIDLNSLTEAKEIILLKEEYPKLLNDFIISLDPKKGIKVHDITCYDHTCEKQGWINLNNLPIVCIPNDVRIVITSSSGGGGDFVISYAGGVIYE